VLGLRDPDVSHAVEQALDTDAHLRPSQRSPGTCVDPVPEGEVVTGIGTVDDELVGTLEPARITACSAVQHHHRRARRDVHAADRRRHS